MQWPIQPIEIQRRFAPRFCPWPACSRHRLEARDPFLWKPHGAYVRGDGRRVPRYRCTTCRRTFSKQTFATSYFLKKPQLLVPVCAGLQAGSAHRQIARSLGCSPSTVTRLSARLDRHALLLLTLTLEALGELPEELVADHFEGFVRCQDYALGIATFVGRDSWFVYGLEPAPHTRVGRRSEVQRRRLQKRPPQEERGGYPGSFRRALEALTGLFPKTQAFHLTTDGHEAYRHVLQEPAFRNRFVHRIFPNPERGPKGSPRSLAARLRDRAMFPVDLLHLLLRHSLAHHRRETIAFGRRTNAILERLFLMAAWRNLVKRRSERKAEATTPAMKLGLTAAPWSWGRVLARRLFPYRLRVPESWWPIYRREWITPGGTNAQHALRWAF